MIKRYNSFHLQEQGDQEKDSFSSYSYLGDLEKISFNNNKKLTQEDDASNSSNVIIITVININFISWFFFDEKPAEDEKCLLLILHASHSSGKMIKLYTLPHPFSILSPSFILLFFPYRVILSLLFMHLTPNVSHRYKRQTFSAKNAVSWVLIVLLILLIKRNLSHNEKVYERHERTSSWENTFQRKTVLVEHQFWLLSGVCFVLLFVLSCGCLFFSFFSAMKMMHDISRPTLSFLTSIFFLKLVRIRVKKKVWTRGSHCMIHLFYSSLILLLGVYLAWFALVLYSLDRITTTTCKIFQQWKKSASNFFFVVCVKFVLETSARLCSSFHAFSFFFSVSL